MSNSPFSLTDGDVSLWPESFVGSSGDIGNIEKTTTDSWDTGEATRITILLTATGFSANIQNPAGLATSWSGPQPEVAYANGGGDGNLFTLQFHTGADMNAAGWWFDNIPVVGD